MEGLLRGQFENQDSGFITVASYFNERFSEPLWVSSISCSLYKQEY